MAPTLQSGPGPTTTGSPATVPGNGTSTMTSASFTPSAGDVLVVKVATGASTLMPTAVSGGGLTWTIRGTVPNPGFCGLLLATAMVGSSPSTMTVSATISSGSVNGLALSAYSATLLVERWSAAQLDSSPAMGEFTNGSTSTANSTAVATVGTGSVISWIDADWEPVQTGTVAYRNPVTEIYTIRNSNVNYWSVYQAAATPGPKTIGTSSPTGQQWSMLGIELRDAPTGPTTKTAADTGSRAESVATSATTAAADPRLGADTAATRSTFSTADTAISAEGVAAGQLTEGPDTGQGTENVSSSGTIAAADPRTGADALSTLGSFTTTDAGSRAETSRIGIPASDSGTRTELVTSRGTFTAADPRAGADAATVETLYGDLVISIWAVDPATGLLKALPDFTKLTMSPERNGPGSITLEYPRDGLNFSVLRDTITADRDLEVEIWNFGNSTGALRGYLQESSGDDIAEDQTGWTFAGGFLELRMAEAIVWPQPIVGETTLGENVTVPLGSVTEAQWDRLKSLGYTGTAGDSAEQLTGVPQKVLDAVKANAVSIPVLADPKRELQFNAVTAGELVNFLLSQARARGALTDVAVSFTDSRDSKGITWPTVITAKYSPGASYDSILNSLASQGRVEWSLTWNGTQRILNCYVPAGRGVDRTIGLRPVVLRAGRNLAEAPRKWSVRSTATAMLGIGSEGFYADASSLDAQTRRGRRIEDSTSSQNLATADAVLSYAQRRLSTKKDGTLEVTHGLALLPGEPRPLIAFDVGDWVYSQTSTTLDRYRVVQWTLSVDAGSQASATVTLNDAFLDAVSRQQKELDSLTSGETVAGTSESSNTTDTGVPLAPEGLVVGSGAFMQGQDTYAVVTAGWAAVTHNTDGSAATDIGGYRVEWTPYANQAWVLAADVANQATQAQFTTATDLPILVRVRAYDTHGNSSAWTTLSAPHTTDNDTTPPGVPSTPTGGDYLGTVTCKWDGKTTSGADMLAAHPDFSHVELHMSTTGGFTPSEATQIGYLYGRGTYTYADLPYGVTQYFRLISVDLRGNKSTPSAQGAGTPGKLLGDDVFAGAIGSAALADAAVINAKIANLAVNDANIMNLSVGKLTTGTLEASMVVGTGSIIAGNASGSHVRTDASGIRVFASNGTTVNTQLLSNGSVMVSGEFRTTSGSGARIVLNPGGTNPAESRWYPSNTNQYARIKPSTSVAIGYVGQGGVNMKAFSARSDNQSGEVNVYPGLASLVWGDEDGTGEVTTRIAASDILAFVGGPRTRISANIGQYYGIQLSLTNSAGATVGHSSLIINDQGPSGLVRLLSDSPNGNSGIQFNDVQSGNPGIAVISGGGDWSDLSCRTLKEFSDRRYKTDIEVDPIDATAAVRDAHLYRYRYGSAPPGSKPSLGLMADELPDELVSGTDQLSVSTYGVTAVLWAAVRQILDRIDRLERTG